MTKTLAVLVAMFCCAPVLAHAQIPLNITAIVADGQITGTITDPAVNAASHCVVVYVHTDLWYIHPYAAGGEGQSWAKITGNNWSIPTVKRDFPADRVAAILLQRDRAGGCPAPAKLTAIDNIERHVGAPFIKDLANGDAWYRRL
jgi:hypothetical protein